MTRREMLASTSSTLAYLSVAGLEARRRCSRTWGGPPGCAFGLARGRFDILEHCRGLGLGAVRMNLPSTDPAAIRELRKKVDSYGMRLIISLPTPKEAGALPQDEAGVRRRVSSAR